MLKNYAAAIGGSRGEVIRRALENFDPTQNSAFEVIEGLVDSLKNANLRAEAASSKAEDEMSATMAYYQTRNSKPGNTHT